MRPHRSIAAGLLLASGAALVAAEWLQVPWARMVVGIPIVMLAPGYGLSRILRIRTNRAVLTLGLVVMLSLSIDTLIVLAIDAAGFRLTARDAAVWIAGILIAFAAVLVFRHGEPDGERQLGNWTRRNVARSALPYVWIAIVAGAVVAFHSALPSHRLQPFVQMSLDGPAASTSAPIVAAPGTNVSLPVAVGNFTGATQTFVLHATPASGVAWRPVGVVVKSGATWHGSIRGPAPAGPCPSSVMLALRPQSNPGSTTSLDVRVTNSSGARCLPTSGSAAR